MTPLFLPLKREYFEAFRAGSKTAEYRLGKGWNARTCPVGRPVVLSLGYGPRDRMAGTIDFFMFVDDPLLLPGLVACYGSRAIMVRKPVAIGIALTGCRECGQRLRWSGEHRHFFCTCNDQPVNLTTAAHVPQK